MKQLRRLAQRGLVLACGMLFASVLVTGCQTGSAISSGTSDQPRPIRASQQADEFRIGDLVVVTLSGLPETVPPHEERIKEDGTITLPYIGAVKAAEKTPGELQKEIHDLYVPKYYLHLTVTVKSQERVYYVGGEVKTPGRQIYMGETTVTKAIQSAGDFTDFANRRKVMVTRADGKILTVNCSKALGNPALDLPVFPGDKIDVPRRWW